MAKDCTATTSKRLSAGTSSQFDEALNALFDLQASDTIAAHAAAGFNRTGAGIMRWYVLHVATEATGERNWLRAWETVERMVAREAQRRRILNREAPER